MRSHKGTALLGLAIIFSVFLAACGGAHSAGPMPLVLSQVILPVGSLNSPYSATLVANGGTLPYTYSIASGSLPPGLMLTAGNITGIPTAFGNFPFTGEVTDGQGKTATAQFNILIIGVVTVTTTSLPGGIVGMPYSATLTASGGTPPYTWKLTGSGQLPAGLSLDPTTGVISGTPMAIGATTISVQATDSEAPPAHGTSGPLTINIRGNVVITTTSLPQGTVAIAYDTQLMATGGKPPYVWTETGTLPPGLILNPNNGHISGVPTTQGSYPITVTVADAEIPPVMAMANFTIVIVPTPPLNITTTSLANATQGVAYAATVMATGGVPPYSWTLINGTTLPPGLVMSPSGVISGTPTAGGTFPFTVQVSDTLPADTPATANLSITVNADQMPVIINKQVPAGIENASYSATLQATGGAPPYTWSLSGLGSLPPGLMLSTAGVISGTPTAMGTSNFQIQLTDSNHQNTLANFSISVKPPVSNSSLNGHYAFSFNGYNNGAAVLMAGSLTADGNGNITGGEFDINGSGGASTQSLMAGSVYSLQADGLGTLTLVTSQGTDNFSVALNSDGHGSMIQDNADPNTRGSGVIKVQTVVSPPKGVYVFGASGADAKGGRFASAGVFTSDGSGNISNGMQDTNDAGTAANATFNGSLAMVDQNGRGTATFNVDGTNYHYAYYSVASNQMILVGTDPIATVPVSLGSVMTQVIAISGSGASNSLLKGSIMLEANGVDTTGSPAATVSLGFMNADGTTDGNNNGNIGANFDQNDGGTLTHNVAEAQYDVAGNGRTTLSSVTCAPSQDCDWSATPPIFYVVNQNLAFVVGTDTQVTSGILEPNASGNLGAVILGPYFGGTITPVLPAITDEVDYILADGSNLTGSGLTSAPGGPGTVNIVATYQVDDTGRAVTNGTPDGIMYIVSASKVVLLPSGSAPSLRVYNLYGSQ